MENIGSLISSNSIRKAYFTGKELNGGSSDLIVSETNGQDTFLSMVQESTKNAVETLRNADEMTQRGLVGQADIQQVVQATMAAEATLQTVVAVRDKLVAAYQEILRMPI